VSAEGASADRSNIPRALAPQGPWSDFDPSNFNRMVIFDVLDHLDGVAFPHRPAEELKCGLSSTSMIVRPEGYTERVGDIFLALTGKLSSELGSGTVQIDITLYISTNMTNRIAADEMADIRLASNRRGVLATASLRKNWNEASRLSFAGVSIGEAGSQIDEVLTISGIRADVEILGTGNIDVFVEVKLAGIEPQPALARQQMTVASLGVPFTHVSAHPIPRNQVVLLDATETESYNIRAVALTVSSGFPESFRTREQEGGGSGVADSGTIIAAFLEGVPPEYRLVATVSEIPISLATMTESITSASIVRTHADGSGAERVMSPAMMIWDQQVPMLALEPSRWMATWEIVKASSRETLTFGIALVGPKDVAPPAKIRVCVGLAPFYTTPMARQPSATLPIPRFLPGQTNIEVTLE
jgi:hypothetical protein